MGPFYCLPEIDSITLFAHAYARKLARVRVCMRACVHARVRVESVSEESLQEFVLLFYHVGVEPRPLSLHTQPSHRR